MKMSNWGPSDWILFVAVAMAVAVATGVILTAFLTREATYRTKLQKEKDQAELIEQAQTNHINDLKNQLKNHKKDLEHQVEIATQDLKHQVEIAVAQKDHAEEIARVLKEHGDKNTKSIEGKMDGAKSKPRLIPVHDNDSWFLAWENTGTDEAYVRGGYFVVKWVDNSGGIQENPPEQIAEITVPVTNPYTKSPRFPVSLPEGGIQIFALIVARHGSFTEDLYILPGERGHSLAYQFADMQNEDAPVEYFMDENFEYSKSPITHPFSKTWPKKRPGGGPFRRGLFLIGQPQSQSNVQEKAPD